MGLLSKLSVLAAWAATATAASVTGPFAIHITGKTNSSIDGYAGACHAGAAIEGLCYSTGPVSGSSFEFYYNYSSYNSDTGEPQQPGYLTWLLPFTGPNGTQQTLLEPLAFYPSWGTNVATGLLYPTAVYDGTSLYFHPDNGTFYIAGGYDDSQFTEDRPQVFTSLGNLTNFHLCYQDTGGYWYQSISWVFTDPPRNPTCQPVDLGIEQIS
ncbi:hypothetical protein F4809DRAFT_646934 [Biscogniauxia mediterranea]|nr:hypothetical protein F4809DRAFT_646934 [Biscogniauxia mediterranea]